jgi:aspartyl protease family protein
MTMTDLAKIGTLIAALAAAAMMVGSGGVMMMAQSEQIGPRIFASSIVELAASANGHYFTTAYINNSPVKVLVDTGASKVAMSFEDAQRAGLNPGLLDYNVPVSTANGITKAARVSLRRVEVDNILVRDVDGIVLPQGALNGTLLGMSFLAKLRSFRVRDGQLILED